MLYLTKEHNLLKIEEIFKIFSFRRIKENI